MMSCAYYVNSFPNEKYKCEINIYQHLLLLSDALEILTCENRLLPQLNYFAGIFAAMFHTPIEFI